MKTRHHAAVVSACALVALVAQDASAQQVVTFGSRTIPVEVDLEVFGSGSASVAFDGQGQALPLISAPEGVRNQIISTAFFDTVNLRVQGNSVGNPPPNASVTEGWFRVGYGGYQNPPSSAFPTTYSRVFGLNGFTGDSFNSNQFDVTSSRTIDIAPGTTSAVAGAGLTHTSGFAGLAEYANGRVSGTLTGQQEMTFPDHIIVLNHGWRQDDLPEVRLAIDTSLSSQIDSGATWVFEKNWDSGGILPTNGYSDGYGRAEGVGRDFARQIDEFVSFGDAFLGSYDPTIHIVGYSLGSVVTAHMVNELDNLNVDVDMATLIDTPLLASSGVNNAPPNSVKSFLAERDDAILFWRQMPEGSVDYVENYYSTADFLNFGQPIAGTGPNVSLGGLPVDRTHSRMDDWYADRVLTDDWATPSLDPTYPIDWDPSDLETAYWDLIEDDLDIDIESNAGKLAFLTGTGLNDIDDFIDSWQITLGQALATADGGVSLIANSPAEISASLDSRSLVYVAFDYELEGGDALLEVSFEGDVLWTSVGNFSGEAFVLLTDIWGDGDLIWTYSGGSAGEVAQLDNLEFMTIAIVPEPSFGVALLGLAGIGFARRR
jgi:hypothetical protein